MLDAFGVPYQHETNLPRTPRYGVTIEHPDYILAWLKHNYDASPRAVDQLFGVLDSHNDNNLAGAAYFSDFNGHNIFLSYYGPWTLTKGIYRILAITAIKHFQVSRVSMRVHAVKQQEYILKGLLKLGFTVESIEKDWYGPGIDTVRLVMFAPQIRKIIGNSLKALEH